MSNMQELKDVEIMKARKEYFEERKVEIKKECISSAKQGTYSWLFMNAVVNGILPSLFGTEGKIQSSTIYLIILAIWVYSFISYKWEVNRLAKNLEKRFNDEYIFF